MPIPNQPKWNKYLHMRRVLAWILLSGLISLSGCALQPQQYSTTREQVISLTPKALEQHGLAFLTPSTVTGQEEDRQALAFAFVEVLKGKRPTIPTVSLPLALGAINRQGLDSDYKRMVEDYRITGIFNRDLLRKISDAVGARFLAQIKLAMFRQDATERWGTLGFRIVITRHTYVRVFMQVWDAHDGSIAWEGVQEHDHAYESIGERSATFQTALREAAEKLMERLP